MPEKQRVLILDFCGTVTNFQTGDRFLDWVIDGIVPESKVLQFQRRVKFLQRTRLLRLLNRLGFLPQKALRASLLKGIPYTVVLERAESFYKEKIKPNFVPETLNLVKQAKRDGLYVLLVSAAYEPYLSLFCEEFGIPGLVSADLERKNGLMTGKILHDCYGTRKVKAALGWLNKTFGKNGYEVLQSIGDSPSDIPVLDLARRPIVVGTKHNEWIKERYEEIFYEIGKD